MRYTPLAVIFFFTIPALFSPGCAPTTVNQLTGKTAASQLSSEEVRQEVTDNTLFIHGNKTDAHLYFDSSNRVFALDIENNEDSGIWDISDDGRLCFKLEEWWLGKARCVSVYRDGEDYYLFNDSGVLEYTAELSSGDSQNLFSGKDTLAKRSVSSKKQKRKKPLSAGLTNSKADQVEKTPAVGPSQEELESTVKWMARDCPACNLANADLSGAELIGANLRGADLTGADLSKANLRRANLENADLENADLSYANLPGANLRNSILSGADLTGANLIRADLTGAATDGIHLEGALLEGVEGLAR